MAGLFVLQVLRTFVPGGPHVATAIGVLLLLSQPYLTLRLTAHFRSVGRITTVALVAFLASAALYAFGGSSLSLPATLALVVYFVVVEVIGATFLALEARRRSRLARSRLATAAGATTLFAGAVVALGLSAGASPDTSAMLNAAARLIALVAAVGYLAAFSPPTFVSRLAQRSAAFDFLRDLRVVDDRGDPRILWRQLCETGLRVTAAPTAFVVLTAAGDTNEIVATAGTQMTELARLLACEPIAPDGPMNEAGRRRWHEVARASGAAEALAVPIVDRAGVHGALVCLLTGSSLFGEDDEALLGKFAEWTSSTVERGRLLTDLHRANSELAHASAAKSDFLAAMSHELRTPLQAVIGFSDLLQDDSNSHLDPAVVSDYASYINKAGIHLLGLINDVLDLSKVEAGRLDLHRELVDIGALVRQTVQSMRPLAAAKHIDMRTHEDGSGQVSLDPARMRQIAFNLISNALKFTPDGGTVDIEVAVSPATGDTRFVVADTGPGVSPAEQEQIFEPFRQGAEGARQQQGTGLGLSLTRRLVELHGGRLELESVLGAGSRFIVRLPAEIDKTAQPTILGQPDRTEVAQHLPPTKPTVLVIEDDATAATLLEVYLAEAGYRVVLAASGEEGLRLAGDLRPAAILLDLLLPGIDGWQVLGRLKSNELTRSIAVLIVSVVDDAQLGLAIGATDYLVKPVTREDVLSALKRAGVGQNPTPVKPIVLAIDDDPAALDLYDAAITGPGLDLARADGGVAGLELARRLRPRAILLDLVMPDLDGFEVVGLLKADPETATIPVIVVTAHALSPIEKSRLNGHVLAILDKGSGAMAALSGWVAAAVSSAGTDSGVSINDR